MQKESLVCTDEGCSINSIDKNQKQEGEIQFFKNYDEALIQAKRENKPIMIDFYTDWCGWCDELDDKTYSDSNVKELLQGFINVKIDAESEKGEKVAEQFGVDSFPRIVFFDSQGNAADYIAGFVTPEDFLPVLQRIQNNEGTLSAYKKILEQEPDNYSIIIKAAEKKSGLGMEDEAIKDCLKITGLIDNPQNKEFILEAYETLISLSRLEKAVKYEEERLKRFPELLEKKSPQMGDIFFQYGTEKMIEYYLKAAEEKPEIMGQLAYNLILRNVNPYFAEEVALKRLEEEFDSFAVAALDLVYFSRGEYEDSVKLIESLFEKKSGYNAEYFQERLKIAKKLVD